ncbi:hypothetical protein DTO282E5_4515 [Paecilomyces variotii]|nr:hypothetical protein DTO282E5_4515 [Paecilomyces variotii]
MSTTQVLSSPPASPTIRGATTEPNSPAEASINDLGRFAILIPDNGQARLAVDATVRLGSVYHQQFIKEVQRDGKWVNAFEFSLSNLPQFAHIGWRIGRGRTSLENRGVDLLLHVEDDANIEEEDAVAGIHARFNWVKGAGGFFLIASNKKGKRVMLNGDVFRHDQRLIPHQNAIMIGGCVFTLRYELRNAEEEEQFQVELTQFFRQFHRDENPFVLPTPSENDSRFQDWIFSRPISRGSYGVVYTVVNARSGQVGAAKRILKSRRNARHVNCEIAMTRRISGLVHERIATALEIHHIKGGPSRVEVERIRSNLDEKWQPTPYDVTDEYLIISPLLNATFRSLYESNVNTDGCAIFFAQLLDAVAFLHENGICHRDIKPDNILVKSYDPPAAMLTDFGCASDKPVILYDFPGTIPYLAPEQVEKRTHDRSVDYWSCGLVGLELTLRRTYGRRIMSSDDLSECQKHLEGSDSPTAICAGRMLQLEPSARLTAEEGFKLLEDLRNKNSGKRKRC